MKGGLRLSYATLGAFMKYPKESLPVKPTKHIADKKYGFFQEDKEHFLDVAKELGLSQTRTGETVSFSRHPLTFLVEAADDICYTIIDFEDGINLGLINEEYALEYLINLVKDTINKDKYRELTSKSSRISYLRALAINALIQDAVDVFMKNEEAILNGTFSSSILDKSKYTPQIEDIIKISIDKVYRSQTVIEKEISGYHIINQILETKNGDYIVGGALSKNGEQDRALFFLDPKGNITQQRCFGRGHGQQGCHNGNAGDCVNKNVETDR